MLHTVEILVKYDYDDSAQDVIYLGAYKKVVNPQFSWKMLGRVLKYSEILNKTLNVS